MSLPPLPTRQAQRSRSLKRLQKWIQPQKPTHWPLKAVKAKAVFTDTSAAVFAGESQEQINARTDAILAALDKAAESAPATDMSDAMVSAHVASDQIDRASDMYRLSLDSDFYETYLDGYGFYQAAERAFTQAESDITAENSDAAESIRAALGLLAEAYPTALRPDPMDADAAALAVAASEVQLALSQ